jgi:23S rRNA (cytosine1962-C5)-methyltransferase
MLPLSSFVPPIPPSQSQKVPRLRLRAAPSAETQIRNGHPWLYSDSVVEQNRAGALGEFAVIFDRKDSFLAIGLFDPESPLRVRVLHAGKPQLIDRAWWRAQLERSIRRREHVGDEQTTGFRLVNGESDGWPGLVIDRYGSTLVMKLYTAAWLPRLEELGELVRDQLHPDHLVLRLSRNIQPIASRQFHLLDGAILHGPTLDKPVTFLETGLRFEADVLRGQKTGFFLDQRENRRAVSLLSKGRDVLNLFSYSGGFSLYAARGGARSVLDLDMSAHALESARRNFALNKSDPGVALCSRQSVQADAFEWLSSPAGQEFDLVVLDPPSMARRESERAGALRAYRSLVSGALRRLSPGGVLVAASCSAHIPAQEFFEMVRQTAGSIAAGFVELGTALQAPDHPATFPEAHYLKCIYLRLEKAARH